MKIRVPAKPMPGASKKLKTLHAKFGKHNGLKAFVKSSESDEVKVLSVAWFHNKNANFSKLPLGWGSTRRKKGGKAGKVSGKDNPSG